jgi:alpha-glucosidase
VRANVQRLLATTPPGGWIANTLGNHDRSRSIAAHSDGSHPLELARLSLALLLTLPGTPFLYNGEEIGMTNTTLEDAASIRDRVSLWVYQAAREQDVSHEQALRIALERGRDRCRTPMQWQDSANAGFSPLGVKPWLPVNENYRQGINVQDQAFDANSLLHFYRRLLHLRRDTPSLQVGACQFLPLPDEAADEDILVYQRTLPGQKNVLVLLNFSGNSHRLDLATLLPAEAQASAHCTFSTHHQPGAALPLHGLRLAPFEATLATITL